jgi:biopolymer transport protein ExbB
MKLSLPPALGAAVLCVAVLFAGIPAHGQQAAQRAPTAPAPVPPPAVQPTAQVNTPPAMSAPAATVPAPAPATAAAPPAVTPPAETQAAEPAPVAPAAAEAEPAPGAPAAVPASPPTPEVAPAELPRDLTPYGMFMSADVIVKGVMVGLIFASVLTWTIALAKTLELFGVRRRLARAQRSLVAARSLAEAARPAIAASPHVGLLIRTVENELQRSADLRDTDGIKERLSARFERIEAGIGRKMMQMTGVLATIGATAPFVGLFGTVWGIMNSFIGISKLHTTNLAVVAPGIAEALLATAFGLAAAIPAVVIYNMFARAIANYRALYADSSTEILTLVSRDLSQRPPERAVLFDQRRSPAATPAE